MIIDNRIKLLDSTGHKKRRVLTTLEKDRAKKDRKKARKSAKQSTGSLYDSFVQYRMGMGKDFYNTREWRTIRWKVISESSGRCVYCGRSHKAHGVIMHVDHILPRSKHPELELTISNLQVLCEDCNIGKGAQIVNF